jgi:hypothetical protein
VKKSVILLLLLLGFYTSVEAHVVVRELENMSKADAASAFLILGFRHILPLGLDHILFVLSLFLLSPRIKPVLTQSAAFTVAHSITLGLTMYGVISPPVKIIEPLIAISILYIAIENIFTKKVKPVRLGIVFLFGLVHGMGFAGALNEIGLPQNAFFFSLISFNIGVELGQVSLIILAYGLLTKWYGSKPYYQSRIVIPLSVIIACIAAFWTVERIF